MSTMGRTLVTLLAGVAAGACGADFEPASLVTGPRLVALVAEPPELGFEGVAALAAVVTDPAAVAEATFTVCPVSTGSTGGYACVGPELALPSDGLGATLDAGVLGAYLETLRTNFAAAAPALRSGLLADDACLDGVLSDVDACGGGEACEAAAGEAAVACLRAGGVDATVRLRLRFEGSEPFDAYKRVRLRDATAEHPANTNPRLVGVRVEPVDRPGEAVTLVAGGATEVAAGAGVRLVPLLDEGAVEAWRGDGEEVTELVSFSWFTTAGSFDYGRSTADVPEVELAVPGPGDDDAASALQLFVVARDDRYGTDALAFSLTVVAAGGTP